MIGLLTIYFHKSQKNLESALLSADFDSYQAGDNEYRHLTSLSEDQQHIFELHGLSSDIYLQWSQHLVETTIN